MIYATKPLVVIVLIFIFAAFFRYGSYLDTTILQGRPTLAYQTIGSGGDPDYQLYCAKTYNSRRGGNIEALVHYDYFFLCPGMSMILEHFEFVTSLEIFSYITILFGSLAVILPYAIFSYLKKFEIGGLIASLLLLVNPIMIQNSDGRFYIYPLVVFLFSLFIFAYMMALYKRNRFWLIALGLIAIIQGISKPFLYVNDIVLFLVFPFLYSLTLISWKRTFPYFKFHLELSSIKSGLIPTIIYFIGIVSFEVWHHFASGRYFFLSDLFLPIGPSLKDQVLGASLHFDGPRLQQVKNIFSLLLMSFERLLSYVYLSNILLLTGIGSLILKTDKQRNWLLLTLVGVGSISLFLYVLVRQFLFPNIYVGIERYDFYQTTQLASFFWFLLMISVHTKRGLSLVLLHLTYLVALAMTLSAVSQTQLFVTSIIWFALLIAYSLNSIWPRIIEKMAHRVYLVLLVMVCLLFILPVFNESVTAARNIHRSQKEIKYLEWAKTVIPTNGYILGGFNDSLPLISKHTEREVIYNAAYVATMIPPRANLDTIYQHPVLADFIALLATTSATPRFYVLDNGTPSWKSYLENGTASYYPPNHYELEETDYNERLNRRVFTLRLKKE